MPNSAERFDYQRIKKLYQRIRNASIAISEPFFEEDMQIQSMADASPMKWHLAHTSWAFEAFILKPHLKGYREFNRHFDYLFNSYYNSIGEQFPRAKRGLLSRPNYETVLSYRHHVDINMEKLIENQCSIDNNKQFLLELIELFCNHEQQHQELMQTDIKHALFISPKYTEYNDSLLSRSDQAVLNMPGPSKTELMWQSFDGGLFDIGNQNNSFNFDNERPQHKVYVNPFKIASRLTTNREYLEFMSNGGYQQATFWLSEAWSKITLENVSSPLYWIKKNNKWYHYTLAGLKPIPLDSPISHVNYFEANAYANSVKKRLPTEQEWEVAALNAKLQPDQYVLKQMFNQLWQWTSSSYAEYPGFKVSSGSVGEYNGKFMVNQYVLRGGSVATPSGHFRTTYRNFFYPNASWQFSGIRLAESI